MRDDYYDRIRDSISYLNRLDDQRYIQRTQDETRDAVYDGIICGEEWKTRRALGIPSPGESVEEDVPPASADERFRQHLLSLIHTLDASPFLDAAFTARWMLRLRMIGIDPRPARDVIHKFATEYDLVYAEARPRRDIFNLRIEEEMRFEDEKDQIVRDVRALWAILAEGRT